MIPRDTGFSFTQLVEDGYGSVGSGVQGFPRLGGGVTVQATSDREE